MAACRVVGAAERANRISQIVFTVTSLLFFAGLALFVATGSLHWSTAAFSTVEMALPRHRFAHRAPDRQPSRLDLPVGRSGTRH
jgi:hypothetical protein